MTNAKPIRVLLVDDSAVIRGLMTQVIEGAEGIVVEGRASNGSMAISQAKELQPDVIVLDIEMPVMDGLTALPELLKVSPRSKVIMASTLTARNAKVSLQAMALGATDYLAKPEAKSGHEADVFYRELVAKICALCGRSYTPVAHAATPAAVPAAAPAIPKPVVMKVTPLAPGGRLNPMGIKALAIASSTGGPQALLQLFTHLRGGLLGVPIFITQHMPPMFTTILAEQISNAGQRRVLEARDGMPAEPGLAYVAPGDYHMVAQREGQQVVLHTTQDAPENFCRPSADPMLRSLSAVYGSHLLTLVLTGMGSDGCEGAKAVVSSGGSVIAQDEMSSVVYGMPKAVHEAGVCKAVLPLADIAPFLLQQIDGRR
ncbi:MAG: chemotaxis response regulator protein-glutamate methylesterase [Proteobacteria bacterium]|nr:chemotaxis response regulator protein-glutamate methylesterase [Pseudomonadota bacterium]